MKKRRIQITQSDDLQTISKRLGVLGVDKIETNSAKDIKIPTDVTLNISELLGDIKKSISEVDKK